MISTIRNALQMASNNISLISNNLANASTTGFKRSEGEFTHFYAEQVERAGLHVGSGAMNEGIRRQFTQGAMRATNGALDLAISGVGMFMTGSDVKAMLPSHVMAPSFLIARAIFGLWITGRCSAWW